MLGMSKSYERGNFLMICCLFLLYVLCVFEVVVWYVFFICVGEELVIIQSVVSWYICILEEYFGCCLFECYGCQLQLIELVCLLLFGLCDGFDVLEWVCIVLCVDDVILCLKVFFIFILCWLLLCLSCFCYLNLDIEVQFISVWMDVDLVDFQCEFFDCVVLLGSGQFSLEWEMVVLFVEWLVLVCDFDEVVEFWIFQCLCDSELLYFMLDCCDW